MKNLLLPDSTYHRLDSRLDEFKDDIQAVRMRGDRSLIVADQPVTAEDYPIHLAWLSVDVFIENLFAGFVKSLADAPCTCEVEFTDKAFLVSVQFTELHFSLSESQLMIVPGCAGYVMRMAPLFSGHTRYHLYRNTLK